MSGPTGLSPLNGVSGLVGIEGRFTSEHSEASPELRHGGSADPRHAQRGEQARPYSWESKLVPGEYKGPHGQENQMLGDADWVWQPAGDEYQDPQFDHTPSHRAGPFPKGILSGPIGGVDPDTIAEQLRQSRAIHAVNTGASNRILHILDPQNDEWSGYDDTSPGHSDLPELPRRMMTSGFMYGSTDRTQSMARQNQFGFDSAHKQRRWACGAIPGNTYWMKPGGRPLRKSIAGPAQPAVGKDSPFAGQDIGFSFDPYGAVLQQTPSEYVPPPVPTLAPAVVSDGNDAPVEWW